MIKLTVVSKFLILHIKRGDVVDIVLSNCEILTLSDCWHRLSMPKRNSIYKGNGQGEKLGKYSILTNIHAQKFHIVV